MFRRNADNEPFLEDSSKELVKELERELIQLRRSSIALKNSVCSSDSSSAAKIDKFEQKFKTLNDLIQKKELILEKIEDLGGDAAIEDCKMRLTEGIKLVDFNISCAKTEIEQVVKEQKKEVKLSLSNLETFKDYRRGQVTDQTFDYSKDNRRIGELKEVMKKIENIESMAVIMNGAINTQGEKLKFIEDNVADVRSNISDARLEVSFTRDRTVFWDTATRLSAYVGVGTLVLIALIIVWIVK